MENLLEKDKSLNETINVRKFIGAKVLSKEGYIFGRIIQIRIDTKNAGIEGIVVKRPWFKGLIYIGRTYFEKISSESIILNIQPSVLLKGKKVVNAEGKVLGRVREVVGQEKLMG